MNTTKGIMEFIADRQQEKAEAICFLKENQKLCVELFGAKQKNQYILNHPTGLTPVVALGFAVRDFKYELSLVWTGHHRDILQGGQILARCEYDTFDTYSDVALAELLGWRKPSNIQIIEVEKS